MKLATNLGRLLFLVTLTAAASLSFGQASKKEVGSGVPDWGQFRGPKRDGISPETGILKEWPANGPTLAWKATGIGGGFSSVSVAGKFVYTMGDVGSSCMLIAISAADGRVVWQSKVGNTGGGGGYPGPRCTPATDGKMVFAVGQYGDLVAVNAVNGAEVWRKNMSALGGEMMSGWGYSESPLLDGPMLLVTPGGNKGTVAALNKMNGAPVWQSAELKDKAAYSSLVPVDIGNVPQYLVFTDKSVAGITKAGKLAWRADRAGQTAVIHTPVMSKDNIVFVSSGYGVGAHAFQITAAGGQFKAQELYAQKQMESHIGGFVVIGEHVYGPDGGSLKCVEIKTGKVVWSNGCVGKGSITAADGMLFVRGDNKGGSSIALVEANPESYKEKGKFAQPSPSGKETWAYPVVFNGRLYLRDQDNLYCYTVGGK
ncbi:MAG: PQQ-like beta-propeller repeat protein [Planctomycetes bacterium]|nr:PQQ-like beta-propeller repeat protein [Planctomycetota bacterium]